MNPEPEVAVHAPLPRLPLEGVSYVATGKPPAGDPHRIATEPLDPDPFHVLVLGPNYLCDPDEMSSLAAVLAAKGVTNIQVGLGDPSYLNTELINRFRQLGVEAGAARVDLHAGAE